MTIAEHLENIVKMGNVESFPYAYELEPELYEERRVTFTVSDRRYTIPILVPYSEKLPVPKNMIDVIMETTNPKMYFQFQLDSRNLRLLTIRYHGSKALDLNDSEEMEKIKNQVFADLSYIGLIHLTQLLEKKPDTPNT